MLLSILHVRHSPNTGLSDYLAQNVTSVQVEESGLRLLLDQALDPSHPWDIRC